MKNMKSLPILLALTIGLVVTTRANDTASSLDAGEVEDEYNGHLAYYITMSKITFLTKGEASKALDEIVSGRRTFLDIARDVSVANAQNGRQAPEFQNGDLGLITYDLLEEELAEVAFDIRFPITKSSSDIIGPVCTASGRCSLMAVFARYRRGFFSQAWWEAEEYCRNNDVKLSELVQRLDSDESRLIAAVIWPHDIVAFRKLKLQQLRSDIRKLNQIDPSTVLDSAASNGGKDLTAHRALMRRRELLFARLSPQVMSEHGEIYAMSFGQIVRHGLATQEMIDDVLREVAGEEEKERLAMEKEFERVDGSKKIKIISRPSASHDEADIHSRVYSNARMKKSVPPSVEKVTGAKLRKGGAECSPDAGAECDASVPKFPIQNA